MRKVRGMVSANRKVSMTMTSMIHDTDPKSNSCTTVGCR